VGEQLSHGRFLLEEEYRRRVDDWKNATRRGGHSEAVYDPEAGKPRGVLKSLPVGGAFRHARRTPAAGLMHCIAHYWVVSWDLRGHKPHVQETLPHPNVHIVFERGNSMVGGVFTEKFSRVLEGRSQVFGIKFKPGGFRPFLKAPVSSLANRMVPVNSIFGKDADALEEVLLSASDEDEMIAAANEFFVLRAPEPDKTVQLAGDLVERILREPDIKTVDDLAERSGISKRSLQRIFNEYVGINPKWVIRRYRLHELVERLDSGAQMDWAQLALELGYFDQAHLINDFKSIVGRTPVQYQAAKTEPRK
jgi:AraC-like DNA-binding protein